MKAHLISKSSYLKGIQCKKALYLSKYHPEYKQQPSDLRMALFSRGHEIGKLAQKAYPNGIDCSDPDNFNIPIQVKRTANLIEKGEDTLYEAALQHERLLAIIDILLLTPHGWHAIEVKSGLRPSYHHIQDAAFQFWVIRKSGLDLKGISLMFVNKKYRKEGEIEPKQFFRRKNITRKVLELQEKVESEVNEQLECLQLKRLPKRDIGPHCNKPYPCEFKNFCWEGLPETSVFDLGETHSEIKFGLWDEGIRNIEDIEPEKHQVFGETAKIQIDSHKQDSAHVNTEKLSKFLENIEAPLYFADFETFMPAIPRFEGNKPYQHLPFQFSVHYLAAENAELDHFEFLALSNEDPREQFISSFLNSTREKALILVYDRTVEASVLNRAKEDFPHLQDEINDRIARLIDLQVPILKNYYYHPSMSGSNSLKQVLPAIEPSLDYNKMEVQDGAIAALTFEKMRSEEDELKIARSRDNLLEYCKRDTLALYKIYKHLKGLIS